MNKFKIILILTSANIEIWRDIKDYEGLYQISNLGNVKSLYRKCSKNGNRSIGTDNKGYKRLYLNKNGKRKSHRVHRLVASAFIPNDKNFPQVNHKDENKENNRVDNLEWCTNEYNNNYGTRSERQARTLRMELIGVDTNSGLILEYDGVRVAERLGGFDSSAISKCCNGVLKTHKNFKWFYI